MKTDIVIGANFGDEGKGLITDFYASQSGHNALVVRHNSSAQAGHTVTAPDGRRHVFGHIGAGSFSGAATYLSQFFACHPLLFAKEYKQLSKLCTMPTIYVDRRCSITTPYDIVINQMIEEHRGTNRHGSCGVGFGETIERNLHPAYALTLADMNNLRGFLQKLLTIRHEWLPKRLLELGISKISPEWVERIESDKLIEDYIDAAGFFLRNVKHTDGLSIKGFDHLVFEGAQGLMLDQGHAYFPHVTRSSTGIKNAMAILQEAGVNEANATYVTRSYLTRHGAGPLPHEVADKPYSTIIDQTNITNAQQGHLRFAWLDLDHLAQAIAADKALLPRGMAVDFGLAVSCMDQIDSQAQFIQNGHLHSCTPDEFLVRLYQMTSSAHQLASYGPSRQDVRLAGTNQPLAGRQANRFSYT